MNYTLPTIRNGFLLESYLATSSPRCTWPNASTGSAVSRVQFGPAPASSTAIMDCMDAASTPTPNMETIIWGRQWSRSCVGFFSFDAMHARYLFTFQKRSQTRRLGMQRCAAVQLRSASMEEVAAPPVVQGKGLGR